MVREFTIKEDTSLDWQSHNVKLAAALAHMFFWQIANGRSCLICLLIYHMIDGGDWIKAGIAN